MRPKSSDNDFSIKRAKSIMLTVHISEETQLQKEMFKILNVRYRISFQIIVSKF